MDSDLTICLSQDLCQRLTQEAQLRGVTPEECVRRWLEERLPPIHQPGKLMALLQSWIDEGDEDEQRDTLDALIKGLNETRAAAGARLHQQFPTVDDGIVNREHFGVENRIGELG